MKRLYRQKPLSLDIKQRRWVFELVILIICFLIAGLNASHAQMLLTGGQTAEYAPRQSDRIYTEATEPAIVENAVHPDGAVSWDLAFLKQGVTNTFPDIDNSTVFYIRDFITGSIVATVSGTSNISVFDAGSNWQLSINFTGLSLTLLRQYYLDVGSLQDLAGRTFNEASKTQFDFQWGADQTAPVAGTFSPDEDDTGVLISSDFEITFNETIQDAGGYVSVINRDNGNTEVWSVFTPSPQVTFSNNKLTINPPNNLLPNTNYQLYVEDVVEDIYENEVGIIYRINFTTGDGPPIVQSRSPGDNTTVTDVNTDFTITFDKNIRFGSDTQTFVRLFREGSILGEEGIPINDPRVVISNNTATIDFNTTLVQGQNYNIRILNAYFEGTDGQSVSGLNDAAVWNFSVATDNTPPNVLTRTPNHTATNVAIDANVEIKMTEAIEFVDDSNLQLRPRGSTVEVAAAKYIVGDSTVVINPIVNLQNNTEYYVYFPQNTVEDAAENGNAFQYTNELAYNFRTVAAADVTPPEFSSSSPAHEATGISVNPGTISMTFSENISKGTGIISLINNFTEETVHTWDITSTAVGVSGATVNMTGIPTLLPGENYYITNPSTTSFTDGPNFATPWSDDTKWNFTTAGVADRTPPTFQSSVPAHNGTGVGISDNVVLTFSEIIQVANPGDVELRRISDGTPIEAVKSPSGTQLVINPSGNLVNGETYYVYIARNAITDVAGNGFVGITNNRTLSFRAAQLSQTITGFNGIPTKTDADAPFTVSATASSMLPVTFSSTNTAVATVDDNEITIQGVGTTSIVASQAGNTTYLPAPNVSQTLTVTNSDVTAPSPVSFSPEDDSTAVPVDRKIFTVTFNEPIVVGNAGGTIQNRNNTSEIYSFTTSEFSVSGSTLTIDLSSVLTSDLSSSSLYSLRLFGGAVKDLADLPSALFGVSTWQFTTATPAPPLDTTPPDDTNFSPSNSSSGFSVTGNIAVFFNESIQIADSSGVELRTTDGNQLVPSSLFISGTTNLLINPDALLSFGTSYYVLIADDAIEDLAGNAYGGLLNTADYQFTTAKRDQFISFTLGDTPYVEDSITLTATASSMLPVAYAVISGPAVVNKSKLKLNGIGSVTIRASQAGNSEYNPAPHVDQTFTVSQANQVITFGELDDKTFGDAPFTLSATASSNLPVSFNVISGAATINASNELTITGAGSVTVRATQTGNSLYNAATPVNQSFDVDKASQTISFSFLPTKNLGDDDFKLTATSDSGLPVSYSSSVPAVASVDGDSVFIHTAGATTITASQGGDGNYHPAMSVNRNLTIVATDTQAPDVTSSTPVDDAMDVLRASNIDLTFSEAITIADASSIELREFDTDSDVIISVSTLSSNRIRINPDQDLSYATEYYVFIDTDAIKDLNDNFFAGWTNKNDSEVLNFNTVKTPQSITFNNIGNRAFSPVAFKLTATANSGLPITYEVTNGPAMITGGDSLKLTGVGSVSVKASQPGDDTYAAAPDKFQTFTVVQATQTITFESIPPKVSTDAPFPLNASVSSGLTLGYLSTNTSVATVSNGIVTIHGVGSTDITVSQGGSTNYLAATPRTQTLVVTSSDVTRPTILTYSPDRNETEVDINVGSLVLKMSEPVVRGTGGRFILRENEIGGGEVKSWFLNTGTDVDVTDSVVTLQNVPQLTEAFRYYLQYNNGADQGIQDAAGNALLGWLTNSVWGFKAQRKTQIINFDPIDPKTYGDPNFSLGASTNSMLSLAYESSDTDVATVSNGNVTIRGVGSANITVRQAGNSQWTPAEVIRTLVVSKKTLTATADNKTKVYGSVNPMLTITYSGFIPGDNVGDITPPTIGTTVGTATGVGDYDITLTGGSADNYTISRATGTLSVTRKILTATADDKTKIYGSSNPSLTITYSGFIPGDNVSDITPPTIGTSVGTSTGVGDYDITLTGGTSNNYTINRETGTFSITRKTLTATADNKTKIYGSTNPALTITYSGFIPGDNVGDITPPTIGTSVGTSTGVGDYDITLAGGSADNYTISRESGTFSVTRKTLTATADDKTKVYGSVNPVLTISYTGFIPGDNAAQLDSAPAASTVATTTSDAGSYTIAVSPGSDNNYTISLETGTLTITKKTLTATADDQTRIYGVANPSFTLTYDGFIPGENAMDLTAAPTASSTAGLTTNVGTYDIDVTGGNDNNYNLVRQKGNLTITQASQTISITSIGDKLTTAAPFDIDASTTATGLPLIYNVLSGPASNSGSTITLDGSTGTVTIEVSQAGNMNFGSASETTSFLVTDPSKSDQTITFETIPDKSFNETFNLQATASSGLEVQFTKVSGPLTLTGNTVTTTGIGTATVSAQQSGNGTYNPATAVTRSFNIGKANQTISLTDIVSKVFGDADFDIDPSATSGLTVDAVVKSGPATISSNKVNISGAGTVVLTLSQSGNDNYNSVTTEYSFDISKASQTITFDSLDAVTFGTSPFDLSATASSGLEVSYSSSDSNIAEILGKTVTVKSSGTVTITASQSGNDNYNAAENETRQLTINSTLQSQTITFSDLETKIYGDSNFDLTASASSGLSVSYASSDESVATISGSTVTIVGAGATNITASQSGNGSFSAASSVVKVLNVNKASLIASADDKSIVLGEAIPELTISFRGWVNGDSFNDLDEMPRASTEATENSPAGDYPIALSGGSDSNYELTLNDGTLTIGRVLAVEPKSVDWRVYPNPVVDRLTVNVRQSAEVKVYDFNGTAILRKSLNRGENQLDFSQLPSGVYVIMLESPKGTQRSRVIKP